MSQQESDLMAFVQDMRRELRSEDLQHINDIFNKDDLIFALELESNIRRELDPRYCAALCFLISQKMKQEEK